MLEEQIKTVKSDEGMFFKLKRKTLVFIDDSIIDNYVLPKIWGSEVSVFKFTPEIQLLIQLLKSITPYDFNICLVNYYSTGKNNIGWHSDNEEKGEIECIASFSFGTQREFAFRNNGEKEQLISLKLGSGSLLVMNKGCQENYEHCLLQDKKIKESRINITFRRFKYDTYSNNLQKKMNL
jgi:hypothetical protein